MGGKEGRGGEEEKDWGEGEVARRWERGGREKGRGGGCERREWVGGSGGEGGGEEGREGVGIGESVGEGDKRKGVREKRKARGEKN